MKNYHTTHTACVNSALIDKYLNEEDKKDQAFEYVYDKAVHLFQDQLEEAECQEDIHDDLIFEVQYIIERDSWDVDRDEVVNRIYSDYDIKGAE